MDRRVTTCGGQPACPTDDDEASWPSWATEPVHLHDPDPDWMVRAARERTHLHALLAPWLTAPIEHIGCTAIPNLPAKPIIDLQAPITDLDDGQPIAAILDTHGWHLVPPDLDNRSGRRFFIKVVDQRRITHLHLTTLEHPDWQHRIAFRDTLRNDADLTARYAALKRRLAAEYRDDREAYTAAKTDFVQAVLAQSGQS